MKTVERINLRDSSVVTSLRVLSELEDERLSREHEAILEADRATRAAATAREEQDNARRRREEDERVAITTAAVERVHLEHQFERERAERAERAERERERQERLALTEEATGSAADAAVAEDADERRDMVVERLREAEQLLANAPRTSHPLLLVVISVATASLALGLVLCLCELRVVQRAQTVLEARVVADERALDVARGVNAELTHDYGVALDAARNAGPAPVPPGPPPAAISISTTPHRHVATPSPHEAPRSRCDPHDPLCDDLP